MKVLYDPQVFSQQRYGGASRYFCELIPRLKGFSDTHVTLVAGLVTNEHLRDASDAMGSSLVGCLLPHGVAPGRALAALNRRFFEFMAPRCPADLYHPTYYRPLAHRFVGKRVITIYDMTHEALPELFGSDDPTVKRKRLAAERADGVICISDRTADDVRSILNVPEHKLVVIPLGAPPPVTTPAPRVVQTPYLLYVGQRYHYKNFAMLVDALAGAPDIMREHLLVCVGGSRPTRGERQQLDEAGLRDRTRFLQCGDATRTALYTHAAAFVYPSLYEGFGLPLLEAMQAGCPTLASRRGALPEVGGEACLYFDPESRDEFITQLRIVLADRLVRQALVAEGKKRAALYSWDRTAELTYAFYARLLGGES